VSTTAASVVVVNYNSGADLDACLAAVLAGDGSCLAEILVVDNASSDGSDGSAARWAARDRRVRLLRSSRNRGYAGGVNLALPEVRGRYLAVLNPDVIPEPGWLSTLLAFLDDQPAVAAVNPLLLLRRDPDRINAAGQNVHVSGLGFNRLLGRPRATAGSSPVRVSGFQGGAVLLRADLLRSVGGWSDAGFLYHEDVELSWLLALLGHEIYCVPAAVVHHDYHLSMDPAKFFLLERNRRAMLRTHVGRAARAALAPWLLATEAMTWLYALLRGRAFVAAKARSYAWLRGNRPALAARRAAIGAWRRRSDWEVLRGLAWNYDWRQFAMLGSERGAPRSTRRAAAGHAPRPGEADG
jgi:GT2 family glycosyltransferase